MCSGTGDLDHRVHGLDDLLGKGEVSAYENVQVPRALFCLLLGVRRNAHSESVFEDCAKVNPCLQLWKLVRSTGLEPASSILEIAALPLSYEHV